MYVDDNGIVRFENLDKLAPLQTNLNTALESVSNAIDAVNKIQDGLGNYLEVGHDGTQPRLWTNPELVYDRTYGTSDTRPDNARLMLSTAQGTLGVLDEYLSRSYMPFKFATGLFSATVDSVDTPKLHTITYPTGRFSGAPRVFIQHYLSIPDYAHLSLQALRSDSFDFYIQRRNTNPTNIVWLAFEEL